MAERDRRPFSAVSLGRIAGFAACLLAVPGLTACVGSLSNSGLPVEYDGPEKNKKTAGRPEGSLLDWVSGGRGGDSDSGARIGVNALLWRASLDTISFMPLASADPFGGVIITDWYSDPATPNERFKASVYILDTRLRADAVRVSLSRQTNSGGHWTDAAVSDEAVRALEDQILTRARQMRIAGVQGN